MPDYAGIRPKLSGPGEPAADFIIDGPAEHGLPGLVHLFGIESPGLTSALSSPRTWRDGGIAKEDHLRPEPEMSAPGRKHLAGRPENDQLSEKTPASSRRKIGIRTAPDHSM